MNIKQISDALSPYRDHLSPSGAGPVKVDILRETSSVADGTSMYLINDAHILHLSPTAFPDVAAQEAQAMNAARTHLGAGPGRVILPVSAAGAIEGRSFMAIPLCRPLSKNRILSRLQRHRLRPKILAWLRDVAQISHVPSEDATVQFQSRIAALAAEPRLNKDLRDAARSALKALQAGELLPRFTPMHGDLWQGNILHAQGMDFVVIDWRGSQMQGYGIYDLVRIAESYGMPPGHLRQELEAQGKILGLTAAQTAVPLLAALGHFLQNLGEFPVDRFDAMSVGCLSTHRKALLA